MLSESQEISWFNKVIFVSSEEDEFVPHVSAHAFLHKNCDKSLLGSMDEANKDEIIEMAENIRKNAKEIENVEVWFDL